jgi:GH25 family lysozyme M1 (1,4-beta-N-acetylmuramidase)
MNYQLPDFSFYQYGWNESITVIERYINFNETAQKTKGVIIRAGQNLWKDKAFDVSWRNSKAAGLLRGSYWFYDSRAHPKRQAEKWVETLGDDPGEMELWADFEERYGGDYRGWQKWYDFMERVKELLPHKQLGVYTGYYYFQEFASGVSYFSQYPLWIAAYGTTTPRIPPIWKTWLLHQFTDDYPSEGWGAESHEIDMNYFNGSEAEFLARYGVGETPAVASTLTADFGEAGKVVYNG